MTFDKKFVGINTLDTLNGNLNTGKCTYLLVHDYFKKNFTLLLEPSVRFISVTIYQLNSTNIIFFVGNP